MFILVQNFCVFFANKTIHDCTGEKHTPSLQQKILHIEYIIGDLYKKNKKYYLLYNIFLLFYSKTQVFSFDIVVKQQCIHTIDDLYKKILFTVQYILTIL